MAAPLALWVTPVSELGGVARHVLDVARAGIPGFRLAVLCPSGPLAEQLRAAGTAVLTGPFGPDATGPAADAARSGPARAVAVSAATLRHTVRALRPAVVHSHLAFADLLCAAVLRGLPVPGLPRRAERPGGPLLVSTEHGISGDAGLYHRDPVRARLMAALHTRRLRVTDGSIAVSRATERAMRRRWDARGVVVVPNGIDRPQRDGTAHAPGDHPRGTGPGAARPRILSLSRLAPEKNLDALLAAVAELRREHPGVHLTLAGDGSERDRLRRLVDGSGLRHAVAMPGHVAAPQAMAEHDVVVQLSRWENCSYTLLDAAAAGLGVVATDVGGNREILPERCLVAPDQPDLPEDVARLVVRQTVRGERPGLPDAWPTPQDMTRAVSALYTQLRDRTGDHA